MLERGGNHRQRLRRTDGAPGAAGGPDRGVQKEAGGAGPEGDFAGIWDRVADADCPSGMTFSKSWPKRPHYGLTGCGQVMVSSTLARFTRTARVHFDAS